jgi:hypothetical protein
MGELVSLSRARKARKRADDVGQAAANRTAFGRTKAEKLAAQRVLDRQNATLDGAKREE